MSDAVDYIEPSTRPVTDPVESAIEARTWNEFREAGMLYAANKVLHMFGWCLIFATDELSGCRYCYPARTRYRGFAPEPDRAGTQRLNQWMRGAAESLVKETVT